MFVVTVTLWCLAAGMVWAVSANAGLVAAAASALLVTCPPTTSASAAVVAAALAVLGGLTQAVLVAAWPQQRWKEQRRALSGAYASVAAAARQLAADPSVVTDPTPLIELREEFSVSERKGRRRPSSYRTMYALPERIAMTLNTLRGQASEPAVGDVLRASADVLEAVASHRRSAWAMRNGTCAGWKPASIRSAAPLHRRVSD